MEYLATGRYYWNSGVFCFTAGIMIDAIALSAPEVLAAAQRTIASAQHDGGQGSTDRITRFEMHTFCKQPYISIDYAVMERAKNVMLVPAKFGWSDVGAWPAVADAHTADAHGKTMASEGHIDWIDVDTTKTHVHIDTQGHKHVVATHHCFEQRTFDSAQYKRTMLPASVNRPWWIYTILKEEGASKLSESAYVSAKA